MTLTLPQQIRLKRKIIADYARKNNTRMVTYHKEELKLLETRT